MSLLPGKKGVLMDEKNIKVLLADDEADFRELMSFWLKTKGYQVITAENGEQALKKIASEQPDVVFLDLNMPVMDGAVALKKLRETDSDLPVIVISAFVGDRKAIEVHKYGISGVFIKGKEFQEGLLLLEAVLRTHRKLKNK
jgi:CheY-like chemotaxis protein